MNHGFLFTLLLATPGLAFAQEVPPAKDAATTVTPTPGTADVARVPEAVHALDIATDVKKSLHSIPRISDPLKVDAATAAVTASVGAGIFIGNPIDAHWGDDIYLGVTSPAADWAHDAYDRYVLEPEREAMGARLRERHRRAKAEHAAQINAANAAAARYDEPVFSYPRPDAADVFLGAVLISESSPFWVPYPRAHSYGGGRGSSSPRSTPPAPAQGGSSGSIHRTCPSGPGTCGVP